ncbi:MAG: phosphodiester glycosidase family protein [Oscillochloris sp.]|nr:phosphodiester glycosidase family protein [Oscillochloris sp.]
MFRHQTLLLAPLALLGLLAFLFGMSGREPVISRWGANLAASTKLDVPAAQGLSGIAEPMRAVALPVADGTAGDRQAFQPAGNLIEATTDHQAALYRQAVGGGELLYIVASLGEPLHLQVITANGAIPASDATGDTIWRDGGRHLQSVAAMAAAPHALHQAQVPLGALAFSFHGAERTSPEGSVVINGVVHRVNAGRGTLCIRPDNSAAIGLFSAEELAGCAQAIGGGPMMLWQGKIANPDINAATDEFLPFNPLNEDFVQLDWRIKVYRGGYPKTAVCVGDHPDGRSFLVLAVSNGVTGVDFARALRDMGCHSALGGDDDTSTQLVWRGKPLLGSNRPVPDALAIYHPAP